MTAQIMLVDALIVQMASYVPARRASSINPMKALRAE